MKKEKRVWNNGRGLLGLFEFQGGNALLDVNLVILLGYFDYKVNYLRSRNNRNNRG